ncbi:hypothetical protein [Saccharopolyspora spinosa]|uniref:Uncharacterized protein n=1 Tax=Saccharopolyspora spinosa TaxID=60894 RepID=A0A2N3Y513_SACSN|nr:hypothetical protein [Saccharopolyspora spinosa]PKW18018.1 hypothetical protein A8926_6067 [Saccharopolyspora spinosa]
MSVQPPPCPEVPEHTVAVARAAFPKYTQVMRARDEVSGPFAERCSELGPVNARSRPRTDSAQVLAAMRAVIRLEFLAETLRAALEALPAVAPDCPVTRITHSGLEVAWQEEQDLQPTVNTIHPQPSAAVAAPTRHSQRGRAARTGRTRTSNLARPNLTLAA